MKNRPNHLRLISQLSAGLEHAHTVGASIDAGADSGATNMAKAMATDAILKSLAACKAGTGTPDQCAKVREMARDAVAASGKSFEELKGQGTVTIPPNPWLPFPIEVPVADLAEAAKVVEIPKVAIGNVSTGLGTTAKVIGWIGDHPQLTLGLAAAAVVTWFAGPVVAPLLLRGLVKR